MIPLVFFIITVFMHLSLINSYNVLVWTFIQKKLKFCAAFTTFSKTFCFCRFLHIGMCSDNSFIFIGISLVSILYLLLNRYRKMFFCSSVNKHLYNFLVCVYVYYKLVLWTFLCTQFISIYPALGNLCQYFIISILLDKVRITSSHFKKI